MIYLFVDTNIYVGARYIFSNDFFAAIEKYSMMGDVKLLTCSICKNEVIANVKEDVEKILKPINTKIRKGLFYALRNDTEHSDCYHIVSESDAETALISGFNSYLDRIDAEFFSIEDISMEELMEDYFQMTPPFEPKKPKEFKDAIMIKALKAYQKVIGQKIHILSNDDGFRAAFLNDKNFFVYEYHKQFLQYLSRRDEVCCAFEQYCEDDKKDQINHLICEYIQGCDFYDYDKLEFEILDTVNVTDIESIFLYCNVVNEDTVKLHLLVNADCRISARYLDEENSIYDSEEKEYIYRTYMDTVEDHYIQLEMILKGTYTITDSEEENLIDKYECEVHPVNNENSDGVIEINGDTLIEVISAEKYVPLTNRMWLHENSVYCSECGKRIGFSGEAQYYTYEYDPLCYECMRDNDNGFVCPNCSKKYPESMRGASGMFCENCELILDV